MNYRRKFFIAITVVLSVSLLLFACEDLEDSINDAAAQTETVEQDLKPGIPFYAGMSGACSPTSISFDKLLSDVPVWETAKGHIKDIKINAVTYTVDPNKNAGDGTIDLYITDTNDYFIDITSGDDLGPPPDDDKVGYTDNIPAGQEVDEEDLNFTSDGKDRLEELMLKFDQEFYICAGWTGNEDDVDMTFGLAVDIDITFVPID